MPVSKKEVTKKVASSKPNKAVSSVAKNQAKKITTKNAFSNASKLKVVKKSATPPKVEAAKMASAKGAKKVAKTKMASTSKKAVIRKVSSTSKTMPKDSAVVVRPNAEVLQVKPAPLVEVKPAPVVEVKPAPVIEVKPAPIAKAEDAIFVSTAPTQQEEDGKKIKLLFVASECQPFCATGGLADVMGSLPQAIAAQPDFDVRVALPLYSNIPACYREKFTFKGFKTVKLAWREEYCGVFEYKNEGVTYYFIDNEHYFKREGKIYGFYDDGERFAFFCKAVYEMQDIIKFTPTIMHASDWQTSLVPIYLKTNYKLDARFNNIRTVFTIHNTAYQGQFGLEVIEDLFGISKNYTTLLEYDKCINLLKGAIVSCDKFTTVSPTYAEQIKGPNHSNGLHRIIQENSYKLLGIVNGMDYDFYNPATDQYIAKNYDEKNLKYKLENKLDLQKTMGLVQDENIPVVCIVSRLEDHKGLCLIKQGIEQVLWHNMQFVVLGDGEQVYKDYFNYLKAKYPNKVAVAFGYQKALARKFYAGSDIFIMPSKSEPCGISQMIASRYGCVPIVRETGGLKDTIKDFGCDGGGNGYTFARYDANDLVYSLNRALDDYGDRELWDYYTKIAMKKDFSWKNSAKSYVNMYKQFI